MAEQPQKRIGRIEDVTGEIAHMRLLALELRSAKFGFVVFEGPTKLLDWGVRRIGTRGNVQAAVSGKIRPLVAVYAPVLVILRLRKCLSAHAKRRFAVLTRAIRSEAKSSSIKVQIVSPERVRHFYAAHGQNTKHEIAGWIANQFEELSWKLPQKRKAYQSEAHNTIMFDAAATGVAFLMHLANSVQKAEVPS